MALRCLLVVGMELLREIGLAALGDDAGVNAAQDRAKLGESFNLLGVKPLTFFGDSNHSMRQRLTLWQVNGLCSMLRGTAITDRWPVVRVCEHRSL